MGLRPRQSASPVPLCFALKQAVRIIIDSPALRDGPPLNSNRGQCEEGKKGEEDEVERNGGKRMVSDEVRRVGLP